MTFPRTIRRMCCFIVTMLMMAMPSFAEDESTLPPKIDFNRDVRPILSNKCFRCHGPDKETRQADLRLDDEKDAKVKRQDRYVVRPGQPAKSELIKRITTTDADEIMPPPDVKKPLTKREMSILKLWIAQGATWSKHWAYVSPIEHPVPAVKNTSWPRNWIDRFLLARLEQEGLKPSPAADQVTLIRRVTFDLTGLPPTRNEVDDFVNDARPNAFERVVDRLLASPAFGERMAAYWLDLVRFADTVGYHGDQDHSISPYRDYVIDAFNDGMPFDRFTREQLAGDLLKSPTVAQKTATGYNRLLQTTHEGGLQPKEYLAIYAADRIRNFSQVWLGATMGCCQCHDHKYDPYTAKDFYSMQALFADIDEDRHFKNGGNSLPTLRQPEMAELTRREKRYVDWLESEIAKPDNPPGRTRSLKAELASIQKNARKTMITVSKKPRTIRLLPRGNWLDESGPIMKPELPEFLGRFNLDRRPTRLDLANWLTRKDNGIAGLTSRVMVNRLWYLMFGVGIAKTLDDFGGQGEPPVHPKLLDNLAVEFVATDWDIKRMLRLIVTSQTYRQSSGEPSDIAVRSRRDPDNRLYGRQSRYRLSAEMIRDNALAVSGLLVQKLGGSSVKPYQPAGYYRHLNFPTRRYKPTLNDHQWRRGVYVHWQRQFLHPMLKAFDAPSREECTAQRPRSNTPIAAMVLLNDPTFLEAARMFAARILKIGGSTTAERLDFAFRVSVSRKPDLYERKVLTGLLESQRRYYEANPQAAEKFLAIGIMKSPQNLKATELAAWTAIARAILNLNETITRN